MLVTVLLLSGFVGAVLAILGLTPRLEKWATSASPPVRDGERDAFEGAVRP